MKRLLSLTAIGAIACIATLSLVACSQPEQQPEQQAVQPPAEERPAPETAAPGPPAEGQVMVGELRNVDLTARTLTVRDVMGKEQTFTFSDSAEIIGAAGTQGLAGEQGTRVSVWYSGDAGQLMATRIEILSK